jgi:ribosome maturation factor RimP
MAKLINTLEAALTPLLRTMGLAVVRIMITGSKRLRVQVMIERIDELPVSMDNCVEASREISNILDVEDPIEQAFDLEVTSPGLDRPLVTPEHFKRFVGEPVVVSLFAPMADGKRKIKGILMDADDASFHVNIEEQDISLHILYSETSQVRLDPDVHFSKNNKVR